MVSEIITSSIFLFLLFHYIFFIVRIYRGLNNYGTASLSNITEYPFVSIIIPFRNESNNILSILDSMKKQDYPPDRYEVIFADDSSEDDTVKKWNEAEKPVNFKLLSVRGSSYISGFKKRAVAFAIDNSLGDIILTTDADCTHPVGWIKSMITLFNQNTGMVAGPVEFQESGSLFGKIQQLEFRGLILAGAGLIGSGKPVTCSAANLAYLKSVFYEVEGFNDNLNFASGDDELLMQKIYKTGKYTVKFSFSHESLVTTCANKNIDDFFNQRKRWASKGVFYKDKMLVLRLILVFLFYTGIIFLMIASFLSSLFMILFFLSITGKLIPEYLVMRKGEKLIFKKGLLKYFPAAELFQLFYIVIAAFMGLFGNLKWKGRTIKR